VPLCQRDAETAEEIAEAARRFAEIMVRAPRDEKAPVHPELKVMLDAFKRINLVLTTANERGIIARAQMGSVAKQFSRIGDSLTGWGQARGKTSPKR
jgi:hypothetical protein